MSSDRKNLPEEEIVCEEEISSTKDQLRVDFRHKINRRFRSERKPYKPKRAPKANPPKKNKKFTPHMGFESRMTKMCSHIMLRHQQVRFPWHPIMLGVVHDLQEMDTGLSLDMSFRMLEHFQENAPACKKPPTLDSVLEQLPSSERGSSETFSPHEGDETTIEKNISMMESLSDFFTDLGKYANMPISDELVTEVEGIVALLISIQGCTDYVSTMSCLFLYIRKFTTKSVSSQIMGYISDIFDENKKQSGGEGKDGNTSAAVVAKGAEIETPEWLSMMRNARDNWALCKGNRFFTHLSKLLGLIVTLGMCKASDVTFKIKEFKVFEPDMKMIHGDALDIIDAAFNTVTFFVETMYLCFASGSFQPLLVSDHAAAELDEEFANIVLWWDLVKTGNLMRVAKLSEKEFDRRLEVLSTKIRNLLDTKTSFEKKLIQDKYIRLLTIRNDYTTMKISSGVRKAPFTIELFGESSQGKTTCGDQLVDALLTSAGLPIGKEYRATYNPSDKFMSNWSTNKEVMFIDDVANDKSSFVERPPTRAIIDFCNNQPYYANMAELDKKGKVFVEPSIIVANTNVKDLDAYTYSNCPYSIQRRMHAVITVKAKMKYQHIFDGKPQGIDSSKIRKEFGDAKPLFDDIWELTVEKATQPASLKTTALYSVVEWEGQKLEKVPMRTVMQYLIEKFHEHLRDQDDILERMKFRTKDIEKCPHEGCHQIKGYCDKHDHEKQFGDEVLSAISKAGGIVTNRLSKDLFGLDACIEGATSLALITGAKMFASRWDWMYMVPTPWLKTQWFQNMTMFFDKDKLRRSYIRKTLFLWGGFSLIGGYLWHQTKPEIAGTYFGACFPLVLTTQKAMVDIVKEQYRNELLRRNTIAPTIQAWRDEHASMLCHATAIVGVVYTLARLYRRWRTLKPQGSLEPKTEAEVEERDSEDSPWTNIVRRVLPMSTKSKCIDADTLSKVVLKNLVYGTVSYTNGNYAVNGLFLKSNVVIVPNHYFLEDNIDVTFRKENPDENGGKFAVRLSKTASYHIPDTDLCICYSSTGGSFKDLTDWFPEGALSETQFTLLYRSKDGAVTEAQGVAEPGDTGHEDCSFYGGRYKSLSINTRKGLCGATLVSHGKGSCIIGFHLGGREGTTKGCFGSINQDQIHAGYQWLRGVEGTLMTGTAENFEKQVLGVNIVSEVDPHKKSPLRYMPKDSQVEYYGSCPGQTTYRSDVQVTLLSEHVMDVCNVPNKWGPPKMKPDYYGWQKCLENLSVPAHPYKHDLLSLAVRDYKEDMIPLFQMNLWRHARPLTDHENLCGIPGKKFMDAIKLDTSIGFPLGGKKRRFVEELEPTEDKPNNRQLDEFIMKEVERCESEWKCGRRAYTVAKACKKDEVLPSAKEKCRIFYGNPIALTWCIRKYFLPILRVMQMNPLTAECAVGINSHGPEWEQFHEHVMHFGEDSIIGGDYGKYDQKLPSQLILAAFRIMIDFARECDYSELHIKTMEALAGDVAYALIAFNGDLIGLTEGTHISGNSLTVVINGICGSLNLRACFYTLYPPVSFGRRMPFRDHVKVMTYGDDNIGSVGPQAGKFTIQAISEFLDEYGQTYTMPDKTSELKDFLPLEEFEFLKRKSSYHIQLGVHIGALVDNSIFKMLHCYMRPKGCVLTKEHACAQNIDTALMEWFNHGPEVYEKRRAQMIEVAARAGITGLCSDLDVTYDQRVEKWKGKYLSDYTVFDTVLDDDLYVQM